MPANWNDAPSWASYIAYDEGGWWWFENAPVYNKKADAWYDVENGRMLFHVDMSSVSFDESFKARPEKVSQVSSDLYKALKEMTESFGCPPETPCSLCEKARAALQRAEGDS